jgi:SAM-dependent methyltransferase
MDIHEALNWRAIWPTLAALPADAELALLDAGCGDGRWARRIAARRPRWRVSGIDRDGPRLGEGIRKQHANPLPNLALHEADFASPIDGRFDVILSIASIHYAAADGHGLDVVRNLGAALTPTGRLILLVPRRDVEQPVWAGLPRPQGWPVFAADEIRSIVQDAGLTVRHIDGLYGAWCVLGKQVAMWGARSPLRRVASAPLQALVRMSPIDLLTAGDKPSYALRVVAVRR